MLNLKKTYQGILEISNCQDWISEAMHFEKALNEGQMVSETIDSFFQITFFGHCLII